MSIDLKSISRGKARRAPRIVLLGVEKIGKSTFASQAPNPIFIPIKREEGIDEIYCAKFKPCESFSTVLDCLSALATEDHDFNTIVIDSASTLEPLVWKYTCEANEVNGVVPASIEKVNGGYGKGYIEALKPWSELQSALDYLRDTKGMGVILIGHVKVKTFNDPLTDPYDQYQFDLQDRASALWYRWADAILFANRKTFSKAAALGKKDAKGDSQAGTTAHAVGNETRYLYTDKRPAHPGGCRFPMAYELPFTYAAFAAEMDKSRSDTAAA